MNRNRKKTITSLQRVISVFFIMLFFAQAGWTQLSMECPSAVNVVMPWTSTDLVVNWDAPIATTNCASSTNINLTSNFESGTLFGVGTYTVSYQATDDCSNVASCSFLVTVERAPADLVISVTNCPSAYPNSGDDYIVDFAITNNGALPLDSMELRLGQPYYQYGPEVDFVGGALLTPSIAPGETYVGSHNFGAVTSVPADFRIYGWNATYSPVYRLGTHFSPSHGNVSGDVDLFCKKFDSPLSVEVAANSYLIDANGHLEYDVTVSNLGAEMAANIMTHVGSPLYGKNLFTLTNLPTGATEWRNADAAEDLFLNIPLLAAGASTTFHVSVAMQGAIDSVFMPDVYAYSHHQVNETVMYDVTNAQFFKQAPSSCGAIAGFTKLGEHNGHGYYMSDASVPWAQAKTLAENAGGYLATMNNQAENDFLKSKLNNNLVFIGYNDAATEGVGQWADNESVTLDLSYNNSAENDYAVMNFWAGTWQMVNQYVYKPFVMEMDCGAGTSGTPDLTVTNLNISSANAQVGDTINVSFDLNNIGTGAVSGDYKIRFIVEHYGLFTAVAYSVGGVNASNTPVGTTTMNGTFVLPYIVNGEYTFEVHADSKEMVDELDEYNNSAFTPFTIFSERCANVPGFIKLGEYNGHGYYLSETSTSWIQAKSKAIAGGGYLATMNDQGENDFLKSHLGNNMVFIGYNDALTEGAGQWANNEPVTLDLSYNNSAENDYAVMNFWAGTWQLVNHSVQKPFVMEMDCGGTTGGSQPDLTVSNMTNLPSQATAGTQVDFNFDLNNIGNATATGAYTIGMYLSSDQSFSVDDALVGEVPTGGTPVGTIAAVPAAIAIPANTANGAYYLLLVADTGNTIAESNENNNMVTAAITVGTSTGGGCSATIAGFTKLGEYNGHGYYLSDASANWGQAKTQAENAGGYLATMNDQAENDFLKSNIGNEMVFIGYNDAATEGVGSWATNESVTLDLSYSNSAENDYGVMNFWAGTWQMVNQFVAKKYVMEMNCATPQPAPIVLTPKTLVGAEIQGVYPNPVMDNFTLRVVSVDEKETSFNIYDARGQRLLSEKRYLPQGVSEVDFDVSELPAGMYFVKAEGMNAYHNFVIMR